MMWDNWFAVGVAVGLVVGLLAAYLMWGPDGDRS